MEKPVVSVIVLATCLNLTGCETSDSEKNHVKELFESIIVAALEAPAKINPTEEAWANLVSICRHKYSNKTNDSTCSDALDSPDEPSPEAVARLIREKATEICLSTNEKKSRCDQINKQ